MKRLLSKVLFLSISATLMFTACEDDDEGVVNGDIVGEWELESLNLTYERVVSVPAGEDQNQEYKNYLEYLSESQTNISFLVTELLSDPTFFLTD